MIAIDFGTTNSSATVLSEEDPEPRLQKLEHDDPESYDPNVIPSAVCTCQDDQCRANAERFGHDALRHHFELQHDSLLLHEMKLDFDKSTQEPPTFVQRASGVTLRDEGGFLTPVPAHYRYRTYKDRVDLQPKDFVPGTAKLVGEIIRRSDSRAEERTQIVIGVPASFGELGKIRLREAVKRGAFGDLGGYERIALYPEPLAAARSYMRIAVGNILVLDYGGGTLDITVMTLERPDTFDRSNVKCDGFPEAGSRMDEAILRNRLAREHEDVQKWYDAAPLRTRLKVKRNVEKAKIDLARRAETIVELPGTNYQPIRLTEDAVSIALVPILTRMTGAVSQTVTQHLGKLEAIDFVVMSGGTSLCRPVQNSVRALFNHIPEDRFVLPDPTSQEAVEVCLCAVARGLALLHRDGFAPIELPPPRR
jgi:molecular chaperone DnaK (HSP70)